MISIPVWLLVLLIVASVPTIIMVVALPLMWFGGIKA